MGWVLDSIGRTIARYLDSAEGEKPFTPSDPDALRALLKAGDVLQGDHPPTQPRGNERGVSAAKPAAKPLV